MKRTKKKKQQRQEARERTSAAQAGPGVDVDKKEERKTTNKTQELGDLCVCGMINFCSSRCDVCTIQVGLLYSLSLSSIHSILSLFFFFLVATSSLCVLSSSLLV
jgi:hypothetical protein